MHVAVENDGNSLSVVSKMTPPFAGGINDNVGLEIAGTAHFFAGDGSRIASTDAALR